VNAPDPPSFVGFQRAVAWMAGRCSWPATLERRSIVDPEAGCVLDQADAGTHSICGSRTAANVERDDRTEASQLRPRNRVRRVAGRQFACVE
jgi:hypothetical protein